MQTADCSVSEPRIPVNIPEIIKARFWTHVSVRSEAECWDYLGGKDDRKYGLFQFEGNTVRAHRVSYSIFNGPIPEGLVVRHLCHNTSCCNPSHLAVGTHQDNADDMTAAGRQVRGVRNNTAKLTETQVLEIRKFKGHKMSGEILGRLYGITRQHANLLRRGKFWPHITEGQ